MSLIVFTLAAFGLAYIVGHSKISLPFRELVAKTPFKSVLALIECAACFGTWCGFLYGWRFGFPLFISAGVLAGVWLALFTCGTNLLFAKFAGLMEEEHE